MTLTHVVEQTGRTFGLEMQHECVALGVAVERVLEKLLAGERRLGRYFVCGKTKANTKRVHCYCRRAPPGKTINGRENFARVPGDGDARDNDVRVTTARRGGESVFNNGRTTLELLPRPPSASPRSLVGGMGRGIMKIIEMHVGNNRTETLHGVPHRVRFLEIKWNANKNALLTAGRFDVDGRFREKRFYRSRPRTVRHACIYKKNNRKNH